MKKTIKLFFYTGFLILLFGCSNSDKKTNKEKSVLEDILRQKASKPTDVLTWLKQCVQDCQSPDKEIAKDMSDGYQILFTIAQKNPNYSHLSNQQKAQAYVGQTKVRNAFLKILEVKEDRDILQTAYREVANPQSLYTALDEDVQSVLNSTIARLKAKPQTAATAWYLQAISVPQNAENVLEVVGAYRNCLRANSEDSMCLTNYTDLVKFYERPRCRNNQFGSNFSFIEAVVKKNQSHLKKVSIFGKDFFMAKNPTLSPEDLLEATLENLGPDQWEIWFSLKTFSGNKLLKFSEQGIKNHASLLLMQSKNVLSEAPVLQKISDGQFRMPFANPALAKEAFDKICLQISHDNIPDDLKL